MFTGDLDIDCVLLPMRHTLTPSLSFPTLVPALLLSPPLACCAGKYARSGYKEFQTSYSPYAPLCCTALLISHCFQSVSQPDHISPLLSRLPSPQLSFTLYTLIFFPCLFLTLSASLSQWIPPTV